MHIKPPDDVGLTELIPCVWWPFAIKVSKVFEITLKVFKKIIWLMIWYDMNDMN